MPAQRLSIWLLTLSILLACIGPSIPNALAQTGSVVRNLAELRQELGRAVPGAVVRLAPGDYGSGLRVANLNGTSDKRIIISGPEEGQTARFFGGNEAIHFVDCNYVTLRNIHVSRCSGNGINADDGGTYDSPSKGMIFENIIIEDIGPTGNKDALKLSGLIDFAVRNCTFSGWGGSAIDMVGCQSGVIEGCKFIGKAGFSQSSGVQAKGGAEQIIIRRNYFKNAGERAVNLGGSTGLPFFRPTPTDFEARNVVVEGNHFVGSMAPIAYATCVDCHVRYNTIVKPEKWVLRILQEQPPDRFRQCQSGVFENNLIIFDRRVQVFVNVGPNTKPETFTFRRNAWFDLEGGRKPSLPVTETEGIYQVDPDLEVTDSAVPKPRANDPRLQGVGSHSFKEKG